MTPADRLIAASRGTPEEAISYAETHGAYRINDVVEYVIEIYRLASLVGIDASIAISQSAHETGLWQSQYFLQRLNPAGLGITGDPRQDAASPTWTSGAAAARGHLSHLLLYATGKIDGGGLTSDDDPRYGAYRAKFGSTIQARTIAELAGKWAVDPAYAEGIARRGNEIFDQLPDQVSPSPGGTTVPNLNMTKGIIPLPPTINSIIDVSKRCAGDGRGYDWLGNRTIRALCLHRSQGTWSGNASYFASNCPGALTDTQINHEDGRMMRFVALVPPGSSVNAPSGWANGTVNGAYGDGKAFVDRYGINAVNRDVESVEITGWFKTPDGASAREDPISASAWATLAQWAASRAHDYGITYETFPLIPAEGNRSFLIWHQEFTIGTGKTCPGKTVMDGTPAFIEAARKIMKAAQVQIAPAPKLEPVKPVPIGDEGTSKASTRVKDGKVWVYSRRYVTPAKPLQTYRDNDAASPKGPVLPANKKVLLYYATAEARNGKAEVWGSTRQGWRVRISDALAA